MMEETNLDILLRTLKPILNQGDYVFCTVQQWKSLNTENIIMIFKEPEAYTIVLSKEDADVLGLAYTYIASWITLTVHSSLNAVGLTAAFSNALAAHNISCNVVAANYHDHIFVAKNDARAAIEILNSFAST